ncbi:MAG: hypothetical protein ACK4N5_22905, partial [Myxococcales bacterium]
ALQEHRRLLGGGNRVRAFALFLTGLGAGLPSLLLALADERFDSPLNGLNPLFVAEWLDDAGDLSHLPHIVLVCAFGAGCALLADRVLAARSRLEGGSAEAPAA